MSCVHQFHGAFYGRFLSMKTPIFIHSNLKKIDQYIIQNISFCVPQKKKKKDTL